MTKFARLICARFCYAPPRCRTSETGKIEIERAFHSPFPAGSDLVSRDNAIETILRF
jgi:hypothetical protein